MDPWGKIDRLIRLRRAVSRSIPYVVGIASALVLIGLGVAYYAR